MPECAPVIELSSLNDSNGFHIGSEAASDFSGSSVTSAGDFNDNGKASPQHSPFA